MKTKLPYWRIYLFLVLLTGLYSQVANAQNCSVKINALKPVICPNSTDGDSLFLSNSGKYPVSYKWSTNPSSSTAPADATTQESNYSYLVNPTITTTYTVTMTDNAGCTSIGEVVVKVATPFNRTLTQSSESCGGQCNAMKDGSARYSVFGDNEPYSYYWSTSPPQTTSEATGLSAGKYYVRVSDAGKCFTKYDSINVQGGCDLWMSIAVGNSTSKCDGYLNCNANGTGGPNGNGGPYTYKWSNGQTDNWIKDLCPGSYCVTVTSSFGCTKTMCKTIIDSTSTPGDSIKIAFTYVKPSCTGQCNGSITANVTGGVAPYTYKWSKPAGAAKAENTNLCAGEYTITVTDKNGRTASAFAKLEQPSGISLSINKQDPKCQGGDNGYACVQASGGTAPYKYKWNTGDSTSCKQGLKAGDYTVTVTDTKGCSKSASINIKDGAGFTPTVATLATRSDSCTGTAGVSVNPNGTYTYKWSNGKTTQYIQYLCAGNYCVTVTNNLGCTKAACGTVKKDTNSTAPIKISFTYVKQSCGTTCDGKITATVSGGTPPYTYKWSKPIGAFKAENANLCAGEYTITVTDNKGKTAAAVAKLEQAASITIAISKKDVNCQKPNSGSACAQGNGGTAPYSYKWSTGGTAACIQNLQEGFYTVTVTDSKGCSQFESVQIDAQTDFNLSPYHKDAYRPGQCDGYASVEATSSGTYNYSWSNGRNTRSIDSLCKGTFCVTVTNSSGCSKTACVSIADTAKAMTISLGKLNPSCAGNCDGFVIAEADGGERPYTYKWSKPVGQTDSANYNLCPGEYSVTVTDSKGRTCTATTKLEKKPLEFKVVKQNASCAGKKDGYACVQPYNNNSNLTFKWSNGDTSQCIQGLGKGTYTVTVAIKDSSVCNRTASVFIEENNASCDTTYQVKGIVYEDLNKNCTREQGERGLKDITIKAEPGSHYAKTDADGRYSFILPKGSYTITQVINDPNLKQLCPSAGAGHTVTTGSAPVIDGKDFGDKYENATTPDCPRLYVNLNLAKTRPCSKGAFSVYYGNNGGKEVQNVVITVAVDPQITLVSSNLPWALLNGNVYTFNVGTVPAGKFMNIKGAYLLSCDAKNADTKCAVAHIYPDSTCEKPDSRWDGSHVTVKGSCTGDSVRFVIVNTGKDMAGASNYRIYKDSLLFVKKDYILKSGDSLIKSVVADGATYHLETDQRPYHPGKSHPYIAIEKCGKNGSSGYVTAYRQDNEDDHSAISCFQVTTSFDPNDKSVIPSGVTSQYHYVDSTTTLTYTINFQNTGSDTAFTVVIRDTLSKFLNVASVKTTETSHPASFRIVGNNVLEWTFNQINLPDSFTNETLSHGFVAFRVEQMKNNAIGSRINNSAAIYFDYNPPVITNNTFVTVGDLKSLTNVPLVYVSTATVSVAPNPFRGETTFKLSGVSSKSPITLQVYDISGRLVKSVENINETLFNLSSDNMSSGLYIYKLINKNGLIATGKLTVTE